MRARGLAVCSLSLSLAAAVHAAYITNQLASVSIGQPALSYSGTNGTQGIASSGLFSPSGVWSNGTTLVVADTVNNRVLIYNSVPVSNGTPADIVIGQPDMVSSIANQGGSPSASTLSGPTGVFVDGSGQLYIADTGNNRVLIFVNIPTANNTPADYVVGQAGYTSGSSGVSSTQLNAPVGVFADASSLYVADRGNNRVLIYSPVPASNGPAASVVVGQTGMNRAAVNAGDAVKPYTLSAPASVVASGGMLYIADQGNNRVLIYSSIPAVNASSATYVVGQPGLNSFLANQGGAATSRTLSSPNGVYTDGTRLFVADSSNNRLLIYNVIPSTQNAMASVVVGQTTMTATGANQGAASPSANTESRPVGVIFDGTQLYVADQSNNRILLYNPLPASYNVAASVAVGQADLKTGTANQASSTASAATMFRPSSVASDHAKWYVADKFNNRVLIYNSAPTANGASATLVVGQNSTTANAANQGGSAISSSTLASPSGVFSDGARLYICDQASSRVLIYNSIPTVNGSSATVIVGQPTSTTATANRGGLSAKSLSFPQGVVAVNGSLIVADRSNNRVLIYNSIPVSNFAAANVVLGQGGSFTTNTANLGGVSASSLFLPADVYSDGNSLYVADQLNHRVLVYSPIPSSPTGANVVLGQPNMTSNAANQGGSPLSNTLRLPSGVWGDGTYLYVADSGNHRVLGYKLPVVTNQAASFVIGQSSFTGAAPDQGGTVGATTLSNPASVAVDSTTGQMLITDSNNNRTLLYLPAATGPIGTMGGTVSLNTPLTPVLAQAQVPPGAFGQALNLSLYALPSFPSASSAAGALLGSGVGFQVNTDLGVQPATNVTLTATYRPGDMAGLDPSRLVLARYDDASNLWVALPTISDTANNRVIAQTNHFSTFQIMQVDASGNDISQAKVYPNPFQPTAGQMAMVFSPLPAGTRLRLYTITGSLVKDLSADSTGIARWDGTNNAGAKVASGTYFAFIQGGGKSRTLTVAVQR